MPNLEASQTDFLEGSWIDRIDELLALPRFETKKQTNGAKEAVRLMTPNIQGMTSAREIRS